MSRPFRIYWHETNQQRKEFTSKLLRWWFVTHGGQLVGPDQGPDLVAASFCSPREIGTLASARKIADGLRVPLLLGGPEAYTGATYLAWADYLCVGEGYRLLADLASDGLSALERPSVLSRSSPDALADPDYEIPWTKLPPVQTAKEGFYLLAGRGCHRKCRFCMTSWVQPHQECPQFYVDRVRDKMGKRQKLVYVTNDVGLGEGAGSTTVRRFLDSDRAKWPMVIRLGIEGVTERRRRLLSKPIPDADVAAAIVKARSLKRQLELFWIIGFGGDPPPQEALGGVLGAVGVETVRHPRIFNKFTWFEPSPHTPLARYDLSLLHEWPFKEAARLFMSVSGRFRVFKPGKIGAAIWSAVLRRLTPDLAAEWWRLRDKCGDLGLGARDLAATINGPEYVDGTAVSPWQRVLVRQSGKPHRPAPDFRMES